MARVALPTLENAELFNLLLEKLVFDFQKENQLGLMTVECKLERVLFSAFHGSYPVCTVALFNLSASPPESAQTE